MSEFSMLILTPARASFDIESTILPLIVTLADSVRITSYNVCYTKLLRMSDNDSVITGTYIENENMIQSAINYGNSKNGNHIYSGYTSNVSINT